MYLNQYWRDDRLEYGDVDEQMTLTGEFADRIWVPDTFFANDKKPFLHQVTESNRMVRLSGDGSIAYGMRYEQLLYQTLRSYSLLLIGRAVSPEHSLTLVIQYC